MNIHTYESQEETTLKARARLEGLLQENADRPILLLLSGGSSLELLEDFDTSVLHADVCITVLDERYEPENLESNNFLQVKKTPFYKEAVEAGATFIETIPKTQEPLDKFAKRWEKDLRKWIKKHPHRTVIATVGIGADGHIAGISPFPKTPERFVEFLFTSNWVKGYRGNLEPAERVTVTAKFMEDKIDHAIVYAVGESKREALNAVLDESGRMADTPARILREMSGEVEIYTDQEVS